MLLMPFNTACLEKWTSKERTRHTLTLTAESNFTSLNSVTPFNECWLQRHCHSSLLVYTMHVHLFSFTVFFFSSTSQPFCHSLHCFLLLSVRRWSSLWHSAFRLSFACLFSPLPHSPFIPLMHVFSFLLHSTNCCVLFTVIPNYWKSNVTLGFVM